MIMKKIIVLGDIEMGAGNGTDDFIADKTLAKLITSLSNQKSTIDLVFNGDTFDFLKSPYSINPKKYTRYITAEIAQKKLRLVADAHPIVFRALRKFGAKKGKRVVFIRGNHDLEIAFPEVQEKIKEMIGNVYFPGLVYKEKDVYIEHGQQYDVANYLNPNHLFIKHKGEKILNNTFISFAIIGALIPLKEENPFLERIKPWPIILKVHRPIGKKVNRTIAKYMFKSIFYYPLRYYDDPTHMFPKQLISEFIRRLRHTNWDLADYLPIFKEKKRPHKIIVLGHIHDSLIEKNKEQIIIRPGTWRDEYLLKSGKLIPQDKQYVEITVNHTTQWRVVKIENRRNVLNFYDVVKNEKEYIQLVKEEENVS